MRRDFLSNENIIRLRCSGCVYDTVENPVIQSHPFLRVLFGYDYKESGISKIGGGQMLK